MTGQQLRVGLIGAGANTRLHHIPGFLAIDGVEVAAVCNRSQDSGQRVADEFAIPRVVTDPQELFADPAIDAICIGTWPYRHREYTVRALEAGKHVLCEARMAMDAAEARAMLVAAEARPQQVAMLVPAPFDLASWRTVRRVVAEGLLGELREVHVTWMHAGGLRDTPLHWRERRELSGMNTMTLGILAEVVQRWLGPTERVAADAAVFVPERTDKDTGRAVPVEIPDSLGVLARMANGARASYRVSTVAAAPGENGISIHGTRGVLRWSAGDTLTLAAGEPGGDHGRFGEPRPLPSDPGTAGAWRVEADFIDAIREGRPVQLTSFEDGLAGMQFTEAVWRSWSEGRPVDLASL